MTNETGYTPREKRAATRYVWEMSIGMLAFLVLFIALPRWWRTEPDTWQHLLRTLLPLLPLAWSSIAIWRHFGRMDEMQRAAFARSLAFGFAVAMLVAVTIGLLRGGGIEVPVGEWIVYASGMLAWGLALPVNLARSSR